ncbi:MAG: ribosomal RNA small subunit methyltransferase A [Acidobacteria bacterium]|uniref:Ribosomal RNA small subunit methyltransferase A n=1 Tax=Candidatus Polarisedimenticola svalbardensis TaxID=2886004 RepID=A0A8J6Y427_9BACT|nr:ribosomal RNA small subunit methyltransferase A [Candidatus Polarisedimenticola svalbardensis]
MDRLPRARKRFGQNFLASAGTIEKISRKAGELADGDVLEIGPGRGALTAALIESGLRVTAVEIDRDLVVYLRDRFRESSFSIEEADILKVRFADLLGGLDIPRADRFLVVGNLPYNISKPVVRKLVDERETVSGAVLMFQKEVAKRLTASPGSRDYGPLGIFAGLFYRIQAWFDLAPGNFRPAPKVTSTVTLWERRDDPFLDPASEQRFRTCLEVCFRNRRQTLFNNLRHGLAGGEPAARELLEEADLDGRARAESLEPATFHSLARLWPEALPE